MFESLTERQKTAYAKKKITNDELLRRFLPVSYKDFRTPVLLSQIRLPEEGAEIAVVGYIKKVNAKTLDGKKLCTVSAEGLDHISFSITYTNIRGITKWFQSQIRRPVCFMGKFTWSQVYGYTSFQSAASSRLNIYPRLVPIYPKVYGISKNKFRAQMKECLWECEKDTIPERLIGTYPGINDAIRMVHTPQEMWETKTGNARLILDDIVYVKAVQRLSAGEEGAGYPFFRTEKTLDLIKRLPYALTGDQKETIFSIIQMTQNGKRVHALIQGDVGCGKTIIAFCLMMCAFENGYQSVLMAPTQILAGQHYEELRKLVPEEEIAFFTGSIKEKDREQLALDIKEGRRHFILGTQALLSSGIEYQNQGLSIADEEHRFGVVQRSGIAAEGAHRITMSATPIPRTLANAFYGDGVTVFQIKEKPAGRKPVITYYDDGNHVKTFLKELLKTGMQAYVVCPLKEDGDPEGKMADVKSTAAVYREYKDAFEPEYPVGLLTGSTKKDKKEEIMDAFHQGDVKILISTTVIEVGVNVPNANVMVMVNAERFGLSTMHQLRGRVGRGDKQAYCVLVSDKPNDRIQVMCETDDGFEIAEADLRERKSGDLTGVKQSGRNKIVDEMIENPKICMHAAYIVSKMTNQELLKHTEKYRAVYEQDKAGEDGL